MLRIQVNARVPAILVNPNSLFDTNDPFSKVVLDDNWFVTFTKHDHTFSSIAIHRENVDGEFAVSGELKLKEYDRLLWEKEFSLLVKAGSAFSEIDSNTLIRFSFSYNYTLHGTVNISSLSEIQDDELESEDLIQSKSSAVLLNDLEQMLTNDPCLADVTFKCGDVSIPAHKCILAARSPVFSAMFAHPMKENLSNEVHITDFDVPTVRAMLAYIYTGRASDLTFLAAADLFKAADKYLLQDLKAICSYYLKSQVSHENVWTILVLGDLLAKDLKSFALDYICKKCDKFSFLENAEGWKELRKEKLSLAIEVLESLFIYREGQQ